MTPEEIAEDRATIAAASPEPWEHDIEANHGAVVTADGCGVCILHPHGNVRTVQRTGQEYSHADGDFIAAARIRWPAALAEIERLRNIAEVEEILSGVKYRDGTTMGDLAKMRRRAEAAERLCLKTWGAYEQSGHADPEVVAQLSAMRKRLEDDER